MKTKLGILLALTLMAALLPLFSVTAQNTTRLFITVKDVIVVSFNGKNALIETNSTQPLNIIQGNNQEFSINAKDKKQMIISPASTITVYPNP